MKAGFSHSFVKDCGCLKKVARDYLIRGTTGEPATQNSKIEDLSDNITLYLKISRRPQFKRKKRK